MRMILTEKELTISRAIQEQLNGVTFDEAIHAIAHARGVIGLQRSEMADSMTFRPTNEDI